MQQHAAALDMAEEAVAEADALVRAFDQARNVRQHEFAAVGVDHAELRMQRGEGIVGDLRLGGADGGEEGRLAGIGQADQPGIGDQLEPQPDRQRSSPDWPGLAWRGARLVDGFEMRVAEAAIAAVGEHERSPSVGEIGEQGFAVLVENLRADRHFEHDVGLPLAPWRSLPMPLLPFWALKCC